MSRVPRTVLALFALPLAAACGAEEPEASVPAAEIRAKIESAIHSQNDELRLTDPRTEEAVTLAFDHVHEEVVPTEGGRFHACVDYTGPDGAVWDIDYYVDEAGEGEYRIEDIVIHSIDGESVLPEGARDRLDTEG